MKPIQQAFKLAKAAACLANEWRDSIGCVVVVLGTDVMLSHENGKWIPVAVTATSMVRDALRVINWSCFPPRSIAGANSSPNDCLRNTGAANITAGVSAVALAVSLSAALSSPTTLLAGVTFFYPITVGYRNLRAAGSGIRDISNIYLNKHKGIWNWPRGRNGGGKTQTQKFMDGLSDFADSLTAGARKPALAPAPKGRRQSSGQYQKLAS